MPTFRILCLLPMVALACTETGLRSRSGNTDSDDTDGAVLPDHQVPKEICDGIDNDGDGLIDEGFKDIDEDGVADCVDDSCDVQLADPLSERDEDCTGGVTLGDPPIDPWKVTIEWRFTGGPVYSTPTVGDLDGDGTPEVVVTYGCPSYSVGCLAVLDGRTGSIKWTRTGIDATGGSALGDIDHDGDGEIITFTTSPQQVIAFDHTGDELWRVPIVTNLENYPVITDLEGDGVVEVIANELIIDAKSGVVRQRLAGVSKPWGAPAVADMDGDGVQEIMISNRVHAADGTLLWTCGTVAGLGTFPHPVNIDLDSKGELFVAGPGTSTLCDDDGTVLWTRSSKPYGTATAIADFDDDGIQEFAFANYGSVALIEPDGSTLWQTAIKDFSGLAGTTSWDIDLDGVPEVIYGDEDNILVLDGATGKIVIQDANHASITLAETPAVADVDGDGQGELLFGSNGTYKGLTVFGGANGDWPFAPPVYNQYSYYGANVGWDLSIPRTPPAPWRTEANLFRGQPSAIYQAGAPNLRVQITDVCIASCEEGRTAKVAVQVFNDGATKAKAGARLVLYGNPGGFGLQSLHEELLPAIPGETSYEFMVETTVELVGHDLTVNVDVDDVIEECQEDDNQGSWGPSPCK